ncbi:hypothetical protein S40285_03626 [Stachybotrys chlorohalonatus IBT 40285]|uniref:lytic cellulose monooxygenase (C4-dehydrogenating) n=1 Tax=Stachybotrys chlorohalonatus (strain IBT 40285) TaxID=1283841 RepID=A0A084QTP4_STAC4|nr:hypothetical protein S40285_03626 [Stachybotrys chlorohalonata IBT 40285]
MKFSATLLSLAAFAPELISAHGFVRNIRVGASSWFNGADPVWFYYPANNRPATTGWNSLNQDLGFVEPNAVGTSDIACHKSATPSTQFITAAAGSTLSLYWNTWPESHRGPIIEYLAPYQSSAAALRFTKISQRAIVNNNPNTWVTDQLIANNFTSTFTIPRNLRPGDYVLRHEIIALHGGLSPNGAQLYPQCLNLRVTGSGSVALPSGTAGSALYTPSMPGIIFNIYAGLTSYTFPGPAVWTGAN